MSDETRERDKQIIGDAAAQYLLDVKDSTYEDRRRCADEFCKGATHQHPIALKEGWNEAIEAATQLILKNALPTWNGIDLLVELEKLKR